MTDNLRRAREARAAKAANRGHIVLTETMRVREVDDRNWAIEQLQGRTWVIVGYYPDLQEVLRGASKRLLDDEHRLALT